MSSDVILTVIQAFAHEFHSRIQAFAYEIGGLFMSKSLYSVEQRLDFINDCYSSGLSVYAWCREKEIAPGTFYSWIHHLKKQGCRLPDTVPESLRILIRDAGKPRQPMRKCLPIFLIRLFLWMHFLKKNEPVPSVILLWNPLAKKLCAQN